MCWADAQRSVLWSGGAGPAVQAGFGGTVVRWPVTVAACVARGADAGVVVYAVPAGGAVRAWVPSTFIDVGLTA